MKEAEEGPVAFADWLRVNDVLQAYADAIDRGDIPAILSVFTKDAIWDYSPTVSRQGHAAIDLFFQERMSVWSRTSHNVGPPVVRRAPAPDAFVSTAYLNAKHVLKDGTRYEGWARYVDRLRPVGGRLLIARRAVVAHVFEGTSRSYTMLPRKPVETPWP